MKCSVCLGEFHSNPTCPSCYASKVFQASGCSFSEWDLKDAKKELEEIRFILNKLLGQLLLKKELKDLKKELKSKDMGVISNGL